MAFLRITTIRDLAASIASNDVTRSVILIDVVTSGGDHNLTRALPSLDAQDAIDALGIEPFIVEQATTEDTITAFNRLCADFAEDPNGLVQGKITLFENGRTTEFDLEGKDYPIVKGRYLGVERQPILDRI